jgi:hypothetical protein
MVAYGSSLKNIRKMNMQPILNLTSPLDHVELEFDEFGVARKIVKVMVHLSQTKELKTNIFLSHGVQTTNH